jgi:hypothetical protein
MLIAALVLVCVLAAGFVFVKHRRKKFNAEETARMRARARRRWSKWLDGQPEPPHDETWVEYQERKRRG